jgi:hypothetical protein
MILKEKFVVGYVYVTISAVSWRDGGSHEKCYMLSKLAEIRATVSRIRIQSIAANCTNLLRIHMNAKVSYAIVFWLQGGKSIMKSDTCSVGQ